MNNEPLGPKDPGEIKLLRFGFARELAGASIAVVNSAVPSTYRGTDSNPSAVLLGTPVASGTDVLVRMQGGLAGCAYKWRVDVTDSNGNRHVMTDWVQVDTL